MDRIVDRIFDRIFDRIVDRNLDRNLERNLGRYVGENMGRSLGRNMGRNLCRNILTKSFWQNYLDTHFEILGIDLSISKIFFLFSLGLQQHFDKVHLKLKSYVCEKCGKGFNSKIEFIEHQALPSCNFMTSTDIIFKCDKCQDTFNTVKGKNLWITGLLNTRYHLRIF